LSKQENFGPKEEHLIEEYKEACADIRHYGNFRSWQMTAFIAITGAGMNVVFSDNASKNEAYQLILALLGVIVAIAFFILDRRAIVYSDAYIERGKLIEGELHLDKLRTGVPSTWFKARHAALVIYWGTIIAWFMVICTILCSKA